MKHVDIALLDFDGTIVDSGPTILAAATDTLLEMGYPIPEMARLRGFIGPPIFQGIMNVLGVSEVDAPEFLKRYRARYQVSMTEAQVYDGVRELLETLPSEGWTLAVASSKREDLVERILDAHNLTDYFHAVAGADLAETRASKEAVIARALDLLGASVENDHIVMVGDRHHDVVGATAHGIPAIAVTWGYGGEAETDGAYAVAHSAEELRATLNSSRASTSSS